MIRGALEPWHLAILATLFMLLFGAKRLPDTAKALGESMHIFKKSIKDTDAAPQPQVEEKPVA
jgi:sec-independent protein translocase protein TatA